MRLILIVGQTLAQNLIKHIEELIGLCQGRN